MNKIFVAVLILANSVLIKTSIEHKQLQKNLIHQVHKHIQDTANKIFKLLNLNMNFTRYQNNHLLLSMHASMKTIAEQIFEEIKIIKKITKLKGRGKPKEGHFNLERTIHIILEDMLKPIINEAPRNQSKITGLKLALTSLEIPDNSSESINFLKEYLYNVKESKMFGFESPAQKIKKLYEHYKLMAKKDFQIWPGPYSTQDGNETLTRRVFGGKTVKIKEYPFVASVNVMGEFNCAASIIHKEWAITAAVCLHIAYKNNQLLKKNPNAIKLRIGSDYTDHFGQECFVSKIAFHPDYDPDTLRNNLAMIKFWFKFNLKNGYKDYRKILYQSIFRSSKEELQNILILGWGSRDTQSNGNDPLSSALLDIYDIERCKKVYSRRYVSDTNICAGFQTKGSGACQRDAGGPGVARNVLVGVVSFGSPVCGTPDAPTVFTNVDLYTKWIDGVLDGKFDDINLETPGTEATTKEVKVKKRKNKSKHLKKKDLEDAKAHYPQTIKVVSDILRNLIVGQDLDNIAYEDPNKDGSDSDGSGIVIDIKEGNIPQEIELREKEEKTISLTSEKEILRQLATTKKYIEPYASAVSKQPKQVKNTELSDTDNYESESQGGISIEFRPTFSRKRKKTTMTLLPSKPIIVESFMEEKNDQFLENLSDSPQSDKNDEDVEPFLPKRTIKNVKHSRKISKETKRQKTRYETLSDKRMTSMSFSYKSRHITQQWRRKFIDLDSAVKAENKVFHNDDDDIRTGTTKNTNKRVTKKAINADGDSSEISETTNELQMLAEQIRAEVQLDYLELISNSNESTLTNITNNIDLLGMYSEEQNNTGNKKSESAHIDVLFTDDKVRPDKLPFKQLKIHKAGHDRSELSVSDYKGTSLLSTSIQADDNLSHTEKVVVDKQLLDYINV